MKIEDVDDLIYRYIFRNGDLYSGNVYLIVANKLLGKYCITDYDNIIYLAKKLQELMGVFLGYNDLDERYDINIKIFYNEYIQIVRKEKIKTLENY